jgi:hypothetical protein
MGLRLSLINEHCTSIPASIVVCYSFYFMPLTTSMDGGVATTITIDNIPLLLCMRVMCTTVWAKTLLLETDNLTFN